MRIGIPDLQRYNPNRGIGRTITTLVATWRQCGHEIIPLSPRRSRLPVLRNILWGLSSPLSNLDAVLLGDLRGSELLLFVANEVPIVTMVYDLGGIDCADDRSETTLLTRPAFRLSLLAARRSTHLVSISDFTAERLLRYAPELASKLSTVHLGVNRAVFHPRDRRESRAAFRSGGLPLHDDDFVAIYAGAEYARKNLTGLIDAFAILKARRPNSKLLKVGAAHQPAARARTRAAVEHSGLVPGRDVVFVEEVDDNGLAGLYAGSDVFVTASKYEGFGLPLLEAMACGLPCVVSNAGALPEVGGDAALYVDPDNAAGFAERMDEVARCQHNDLVERALARAAHFDWATTARDILQILEAATSAREGVPV
jgi:glycosyltransferase involved in cell wall biosynthesis